MIYNLSYFGAKSSNNLVRINIVTTVANFNIFAAEIQTSKLFKFALRE